MASIEKDHIEIRPKTISRSMALAKLHSLLFSSNNNNNSSIALLALGTEKDDEIFEWLDSQEKSWISCSVGNGCSKSNFYVNSPEEILEI
jgi:trehalose-6-phosphatase